MNWVVSWLRFDDLWTDDKLLLDNENWCIVIVDTTVISAGCDGNEVIWKPFDSVRADGMRSDHHAQVISFEEWVQVVRAEIDNIVYFLRITIVVVLESSFFFCLMRITPQNVENFLVIVWMIGSKFNFKRSLNSFNTLNILNSWSDSSMTAENSLLLIRNNSSQRHLLESFIDLSKYTVRVIWVFT